MSNNRATYISALLGFLTTSALIILTHNLFNVQNVV